MVRLTADLIWKSPHFFNALRERELDLRGYSFSSLNGFSFHLNLVFDSYQVSLYFCFCFLSLVFSTGNKIAVIENLGATEVSIFVFRFLGFESANEY